MVDFSKPRPPHEDEHDPSLDDQSRPDELDTKVLDSMIAAIDEDANIHTDWERRFIRSIHRQLVWTDKQCTIFDQLAQDYKED